MNSFQAKIGWKNMRKREIKIIVPFRSVPARCVIENSKQIAKKFKKLKNTIVALPTIVMKPDNNDGLEPQDRVDKIC